MTKAGVLSSRLYSRMLILYPEDLRRDYGTEMAMVFADDLEAARREAGMRGVVRVWRCALGEFVRIALPACTSSAAVRVAAIWFAISSVILSVEVAMEIRHDPLIQNPLHAICAALLLPSMGAPLMSLAIMWACRSSAILSLGLCERGEGNPLADARGSDGRVAQSLDGEPDHA